MTVHPSDPRPLHLRASDADRSQVTQFLNDAYAEGRLRPDEHTDRIEAALRAKTLGELAPLTADLGPQAPVAATAFPRPPAVPAAARTYELDTVQGRPHQTLFAVFSATTRRGPWRIKPRIDAIATFGGVDLDMREATFEASEVVINATAVFGAVEIKVPDGVEVVDETWALFGGTEVKRLTPAEPGAPRLVVRGFALFGGIEVKGNGPSSVRTALRAARREWRDERRSGGRELR